MPIIKNKNNKGEIATTLTIIGVGIMLLGSIIGTIAVQGPLKNILKAQTALECDTSNPNHLCKTQLRVQAFIDENRDCEGGFQSGTDKPVPDRPVILQRPDENVEATTTRPNGWAFFPRPAQGYGDLNFVDPPNDKAILTLDYSDPYVGPGGRLYELQPCANQRGVDTANKVITRTLTKDDFKSLRTDLETFRFTRVLLAPTATPTPDVCPDLSAPTNLQPQGEITPQTRNFTWNEVENAEKYAIRINDASDNWPPDVDYNNDGEKTCDDLLDAQNNGENLNDICRNDLVASDICYSNTCTFDNNGQGYELEEGKSYDWWVHGINACEEFGAETKTDIIVTTVTPTPSPTTPALACNFRSLAYVRDEAGNYLNIIQNDINWGTANDKWRTANGDRPRNHFGTAVGNLASNPGPGRFLVHQNDLTFPTVDGYQKGEKSAVKVYYDTNNWQLIDKEVRKCEVDGVACENAGVAVGFATATTGLDEIPNLPVDCGVDVEFGWVLKRTTPEGETSQIDWLMDTTGDGHFNEGVCWSAKASDSCGLEDNNGSGNLPQGVECTASTERITLKNNSSSPYEISCNKYLCNACSQSTVSNKAQCDGNSQSYDRFIPYGTRTLNPGSCLTCTSDGNITDECPVAPPPGGDGGGNCDGINCHWCTNEPDCNDQPGGPWNWVDDGGYCADPADKWCQKPGCCGGAGQPPSDTCIDFDQHISQDILNQFTTSCGGNIPNSGTCSSTPSNIQEALANCTVYTSDDCSGSQISCSLPSCIPNVSTSCPAPYQKCAGSDHCCLDLNNCQPEAPPTTGCNIINCATRFTNGNADINYWAHYINGVWQGDHKNSTCDNPITNLEAYCTGNEPQCEPANCNQYNSDWPNEPFYKICPVSGTCTPFYDPNCLNQIPNIEAYCTNCGIESDSCSGGTGQGTCCTGYRCTAVTGGTCVAIDGLLAADFAGAVDGGPDGIINLQDWLFIQLNYGEEKQSSAGTVRIGAETAATILGHLGVQPL